MIAKSFAQIPDDIRNMIPNSDYSNAEKFCQQEMPITRLMKEAYMELHQG